MTIWSRMRRLDDRVFPTGRRPTQRAVTRASWVLVTLMGVLLIAQFFDHTFGVALGAIAFSAGLWSGRLQEAGLAAKGRGIIMESSGEESQRDGR
jgi:hypothetical protein